jgi:hypothetical protein
MPIITNITAASRVSLIPERKRMKPPRPTRPKARAVLWPITTTMSAPAIAIRVCAWATSRAGGSAFVSRRRQGRNPRKAPRSAAIARRIKTTSNRETPMVSRPSVSFRSNGDMLRPPSPTA